MSDCVIVGGGAIGLSLAYELARNDARVTVLDRGPLGAESSWAGAGILPAARLAAAGDSYGQLAGLSCALHPRWATDLREATGIDNGYRQCGGIYLARTAADEQAVAEIAADCRRQNIAARRLAPADAAALEPALGPWSTSPWAALHVPDDAQLRNPRHVRALALACERLGVLLRPGVECRQLCRRGDRVVGVATADGVVPAESVCLTAGAWTGMILERLGVKLPVRPVRGQIALLRTERPLLTAVVNEGPRYLVPRDDGRLLVGSTEEDVGFDSRTTAEAIGGLLHFACDIVPGLAAASVERAWAGLRPASADGRPYLGRVAGLANLYCAAGHFRAGLMLSPGTAVVMSRLIMGQPAGFDMSGLAPDRAVTCTAIPPE
jgi:glycine oxidase